MWKPPPPGTLRTCPGLYQGLRYLYLYLYFSTFFCVTDRIINDNALERMRKDVIVHEFVLTFRDLPGGAEKRRANLSLVVQCTGRVPNQEHPKYRSVTSSIEAASSFYYNPYQQTLILAACR